MKFYVDIIFLLTIGCIICSEAAERCKKKKKFYGCNYDKSLLKCVCWSTWGCRDAPPFKFYSKEECQNHIDQQEGACKRFPCDHGTCTSTHKMKKYLCDCLSTGFYGKRCHKPCPKRSELSIDYLQQFLFKEHWQHSPLACIM